ncbi:hypothetical protein SBDP1_1330004 [Syntrophobacter sp. SbD1]|nr:hypothetical protein SBDP1_1330004 [Syntrophobacter sp. SbD1]
MYGTPFPTHLLAANLSIKLCLTAGKHLIEIIEPTVEFSIKRNFIYSLNNVLATGTLFNVLNVTELREYESIIAFFPDSDLITWHWNSSRTRSPKSETGFTCHLYKSLIVCLAPIYPSILAVEIMDVANYS